MTDADGDSVWEITLPLNIGDSIRYKFTVNGGVIKKILFLVLLAQIPIVVVLLIDFLLYHPLTLI